MLLLLLLLFVATTLLLLLVLLLLLLLLLWRILLGVYCTRTPKTEKAQAAAAEFLYLYSLEATTCGPRYQGEWRIKWSVWVSSCPCNLILTR
ncbi:hypothetical protein PgNI_10734 [Pyricularia grisea]|uniref:Uncharacterized protein n=1 Tax=Pyricularia grisea TaxID=148305 RepID=A0A6P8AYK5_PYRGI|nr:hypothetical protein PgNI_10734 [Pyricularia grisea]TLD07443.1 hypothetical protein PgNI_10734 [Pyricularia grisea]